MSTENECLNRNVMAPATPGTETIWAWGLATLLLIALGFTSHQLTQAQQQLEEPESEASSTQRARNKTQVSHPDMAKIIHALKKVDSAGKLKAAKLKADLHDAASRLEAALEETEKLAAAQNDIAGLRGELKAAQNKLNEAIAEVGARTIRAQRD